MKKVVDEAEDVDHKGHMKSANDSRNFPRTSGAGRDVWTAISTIEKALAAGNYDTARKAAIYAFPRLSIPLAVPTSDDPTVWSLVLRTLKARAETRDAEARALRMALAG